MIKEELIDALTRKSWFVHILLLLATALISTSFPVVKSIADTMDPLALTWARFTIAAALFFPLVVWKNGFQWPDRYQLLRYALISLSLISFFWCMFESLRYTSTLNTSVIYTLIPGISGIYNIFLLGERLGRQLLICPN